MTTCSASSIAVGEPTIGTAPTAAAWVCLEQPGAWGPKAFTSSRLDPDVGKAFENAATQAGVRPQLIRSPGRHPASESSARTVLVASTTPRASWLLQGRIDDPARILDLDFEAIAAGLPPEWPELAPTAEAILLVCTNGRRDVCCATLGRSVAESADRAFPGRVWEANHLSGHRFAATTALLPSGHLHGRVLDGSVLLEAADRGQLATAGWRGRSTWPPAGQAAEEAVRNREGLWDIDGFDLEQEGDMWRVATSGQAWRVRVSEAVQGEAPPSCGKTVEPVHRFESTIQ